MYAKNFDPNTKEYIVHTQDVDKLELPTILIELSKKYFEELGNSILEISTNTSEKETVIEELHQCQDCLTLYNPLFGDRSQGIQEGVHFTALPEHYCCSLCDAPKGRFKQISSKKIVVK